MPLGILLDQLDRARLGAGRVRRPTHASEQVGAGGMREVVLVQVAAADQRVDQLAPSGPCRIAIATARLSSTTGDGSARRSRS